MPLFKTKPSGFIINLIPQRQARRINHLFPPIFINSITTSGADLTQVLQSVKTASMASDKSGDSTAGCEDLERPPFHTSASSDRTDSPIVEEPEDHHFHQEDTQLRKNSLVIVESTDEQPEELERHEEELLEKVSCNNNMIREVGAL